MKKQETIKKKTLKEKTKHDDIASLKKQLEQKTQDWQESHNKYLRAIADLDNFRKRKTNEISDIYKYSSFAFINNFLKPYQQLTKILNLKPKNKDIQNYFLGFKMIQKQIDELLQQEGLKIIPALNTLFDPQKHQALEKINDSTKENNLILEVIEDGFFYKDRLLKPALVKVNFKGEQNEKNK